MVEISFFPKRWQDQNWFGTTKHARLKDIELFFCLVRAKQANYVKL
jgi:hypothetical protein